MWEVNLKQVCFRFVWLFIFADSFYQMFGFKFLQQEKSWKVVSKVHTHYFRVVLLLSLPRYCLKQQRKKSDLDLVLVFLSSCRLGNFFSPKRLVNPFKLLHLYVLQRKPFAFELFFCLANAGFFIFSSKTRSIVSTSNLYWNVQLALLCVFNAKVKNLAFDTSKVITNAWFSMKNLFRPFSFNIVSTLI